MVAAAAGDWSGRKDNWDFERGGTGSRKTEGLLLETSLTGC